MSGRREKLNRGTGGVLLEDSAFNVGGGREKRRVKHEMQCGGTRRRDTEREKKAGQQMTSGTERDGQPRQPAKRIDTRDGTYLTELTFLERKIDAEVPT